MAILSKRFIAQGLLPFFLVVGISFGGTVISLSAQCSLVCKPSLQVALNQNGQALINTQMIAPGAASSCPGTLSLELLDNYGSTLPNPLNCNQLGENVTALITHNASGNSCSCQITVIDGLSPVISCPDIWIWCNQEPDPALIGAPTSTDNCTNAALLSMVWNDTPTEFACGTTQNGFPIKRRIDRNWRVSDAAGNSTQCTQKIWAKQITLGAIAFPPNRDGLSAPVLNCGQDPYDLNLTGQPSVDGAPIDNFNTCDVGITYADQKLDVCPPAGYAILRTWTAVDFCLGLVFSKIQIIKVQDNTPPALSPPPNITVGTSGFGCSASVLLPQATASDNCSSVVVNPSWNFGSGYGPFNNVPVGVHTVTYVATDACNNVRTSTMRVTVVDQTPPQAICKSSLQISLLSNGGAQITPSVMDGGSSDNCGPVTMQVSRDAIHFDAAVPVTCADLSNPVIFTLKVTDAAGQSNICETNITVRDFLKPDMQCPNAVFLNCLDNYKDLNMTGKATASDNCGIDTLYFTDVGNPGACNIGNIQRVWRAIDQAGNVRSCTQQISITALSPTNVLFPSNKTLSACAGPQDLAPASTGTPQIIGQYCSPLSISYTDNLIQAPAPYCKRIFRSWKVVDPCIYTGNLGSPGIWEYVQTIDVVDQQGPILNVPAPVLVSTGSGGCQAFVDLPEVSAQDCSTVLSIVHNSPYALNLGANASGLYPVGMHQVVFTATDDCGNTSQKTVQIEVRDQTKPIALCKTGLSIPLNASGYASISPDEIDAGSYDACTTPAFLSKYVAPSNFDCQSLGFKKISLTIGDASGNVAVCTTMVSINDPNQVCASGPTLRALGGGIRTEQGDTVRNIPVELYNNGLYVVNYCDSTGRFRFDDLASDSSYHIHPINNANWSNGISTYDLLLISRHILGIQPLNSPYKLIAADANKSGSVTTFDIVQLRKLILGIYDTLPGINSWRFIPASHSFINPNNPFYGGFPEEIFIQNLNTDSLGNQFVGIKVGDVNNSSNPAQARTGQDTAWLSLQIMDIPGVDSVRCRLKLEANRRVDGIQFALGMPANKQFRVEIPEESFLRSENWVQISPEELRVSWNRGLEQTEHTDLLDFVCVKNGNSLNYKLFFSLIDLKLKSEVYIKDEIMHLAIRLPVGETAPSNREWDISADPNPFVESIWISCRNCPDARYLLEVYDVTGRLVYSDKKAAAPGNPIAQICGTNLPGAGVYFYRVVLDTNTIKTGRMVYVNSHN